MDYLFKYMLLSFSICCARTIQATRDESSQYTHCDLMCRQNGNKRCLSDRLPYECGCAESFVERDGVCWETTPDNERKQQSKNKDRLWELEELESIGKEREQNSHAGLNSHHGHHGDKNANLHRVNHEEHAHSPHKDKLKHLQHVARTLAPPVLAGGQGVVPPHSEKEAESRFNMPKSPNGDEYRQNNKNKEDGGILGGEDTGELEIPHNPPKEYHIRPKPHHKHAGKHQKEAQTDEVAFVGEDEDEEATEKPEKPANQDAAPVVPVVADVNQEDVNQQKEVEPNIHGKASAVKNTPDDRHGKMRDVASMADVYFLAQNVPKVFHAVDTHEEDIKDIQLQARDNNDSDPKGSAPHSASASAGAANTVTISSILFVAVVAGCSVAGLMGLVVAGVCWYRLQKNVKAASESEYPAYGVTGPSRDKAGSPGDRKLAQSAQMYHYQHQKQQMLAMEKAQGELGGNGSDVDSEEEEEGADYTVYECPGLAPTGEMEVKNPLFTDDTPVGQNSNGEETQHK